MPYKHNEKRRHKIQKSRYKVTNWADYVRRGKSFQLLFQPNERS